MTDRGDTEGLSSDDLLAEAKDEFGLDDGSSGVADSLLESSVDGDDLSMTAEEIAAELAGDQPEAPAEPEAPDVPYTDFAEATPELDDAPMPPDVFAQAPPSTSDTLPAEMEAPEPAAPAPVDGRGGGLLSLLWRNRWIVAVAIVGVTIVAGLLDNSEAVADLSAGDCFNDPGADIEVSEVDVIDCDKEHDLEVVGTVALFGAEYPGDFGVAEQGFNSCLDLFEPYVGEPYESSILYLIPFTPTEQSWEAGDREALCVAYEPVPGTDGFEVARRSGSLRGSGL